MSHKFDGTWSHFKISVAGMPQNAMTPGVDFVLVINDAGTIVAGQSTVDGVEVQSGTATANTIDLNTSERRYFGRLLKNKVVNGQSVYMVIAGRFRRLTAVPLKDKAKQKAEEVSQNEGDWVITKP